MKIKKHQVKVIVSFIAILVAVVLYSVFAWVNKLPPFKPTSVSYEPGDQIVNMQRSDTEKQKSAELQANPKSKLDNAQTDVPGQPKVDSATNKAQVSVLLTHAGVTNNTVTVSGMATNLSEENGSCKYVFIHDNKEITKVTSTMPTASATSCKTTSFPSSELTKGSWRVYLKYASASSEGSSATKEFIVE